MPATISDLLKLAQSLPRIATEPTVAATLDLPTDTLRTRRLNGTGPEHDTMVNGQTTYRRAAVIAWLHTMQAKGDAL